VSTDYAQHDYTRSRYTEQESKHDSLRGMRWQFRPYSPPICT